MDLIMVFNYKTTKLESLLSKLLASVQSSSDVEIFNNNGERFKNILKSEPKGEANPLLYIY